MIASGWRRVVEHCFSLLDSNSRVLCTVEFHPLNLLRGNISFLLTLSVIVNIDFIGHHEPLVPVQVTFKCVTVTINWKVWKTTKSLKEKETLEVYQGYLVPVKFLQIDYYVIKRELRFYVT